MSDVELALSIVQEEVKPMREAPALLENSGVGDSQANGAVERVVQALGEQARALRQELEAPAGIKLRCFHLVVSWIVDSLQIRRWIRWPHCLCL